jgi:uncharacterized membrane protein YcaP (DUF421 family)
VLHNLFHLGASAPEKIVRTLAVYLLLLVLLHLAGKRELAQLNSFDLVVLLLLSNVVQNAIIGNDNSLLGGAIGAALLLAANYVLVRFAFFHPRWGRALQGGETTLVERGKPLERMLRRERITSAQLDAAMRRQGLDNGTADAERIVLEPEGTLTAYRKPVPTLADVVERLERIERKLA